MYIKKLKSGGHLGRHLEFPKTLMVAELSPDGILNAMFPLSQSTETFFTSPFLLVLGVYRTIDCID